MYIVNQTRSEITNVENVTHLNYDGGMIFAFLTGGMKRILGNYDREERGKEVFQEMLESCFPESFVLTLEGFDSGVYYMPEE